MTRKSKGKAVKISYHQGVLDAVFDECDKYNSHETGGRLIGTFDLSDELKIDVSGVIEPGPGARRTETSFFQDGAYQEKVFRSIEKRHAAIEHLGNWHTHHVNGYPGLSSGDISTYQKIVNHANHNTDIFYALLVVAKTPNSSQRYKLRHYLLYRGDPDVYEIPSSDIQIVERPPVWPIEEKKHTSSEFKVDRYTPDENQERVRDREMFSEMYPQLKSYFSKSMGAVYWKGAIALIDGTTLDVVIMESTEKNRISYSINPIGASAKTFETIKSYGDRSFKSARIAVWEFERGINREIYSKLKTQP